ncbi:hypothetical protein AM593_02560, partial [Mytilus galloprovincialis]
LVGAEGTGKHELAKGIISIDEPFSVQIRTAICLPLSTEDEESRPRIDFICFIQLKFLNPKMQDAQLLCQRHKQRAENNPRPPMGLQHMTNPAPRGDTLPADLEMMASYTDNMRVVEESVKHVDLRYFLGRSCFVALKVKCPEKRGVGLELVSEFCDHYGAPILYGALESDQEQITLASAGLVNNISPLLIDSTRRPYDTQLLCDDIH